MPLVSVIIPTYNRKDYLGNAIDSVLAQTYQNYEIIVIDDGSTDGTKDFLEAKFGNQIRYLWQKNQGESSARNIGIQMSHCEYVALLDSDDVWLPEKLDQQIPILSQHNNVGMVCSQAWLIDSEGIRELNDPLRENITAEDLSFENLCFYNPVVASSAILKKQVFDRLGGFDQDIKYGEDWDLWLRLALDWELAIVPEPLVLFRKHHDSQHHSPTFEQLDRELQDRLYMFEKIFKLNPDRCPKILRMKAEAQQYGLNSFKCYTLGLGIAGKENLTRAAQFWSARWTNLEMLSWGILNMAISHIESEGLDTAQSIIKGIDKALDYWPGEIYRPVFWKRQFIGKLWITSGFAAHKKGNNQLARKYFIKGLAKDITWIKNKGILSILAY